MAKTLRLFGDGAPPAPPAADPTGYATVARRITRRPGRQLRVAKVVLDGLIGLCWADSRQTDATLEQIAAAAGMPVRTCKTHLARLVAAGLIDRRRSPRNGNITITRLLLDPKGFQLTDEPRANWRVVHAIDAGRKRPTHGPKTAHARAENGPPLLTVELDLLPESPPQPPKGGVEEISRPRKPRRKTRKEEADEFYRWFAESGPELPR